MSRVEEIRARLRQGKARALAKMDVLMQGEQKPLAVLDTNEITAPIIPNLNGRQASR